MTTNTHNDWYTTTFKAWQAKAAGPKPTADQLATVHRLGARPGKQAMAIAMMLRDCGATNSQIVLVCGNPQLNKMRGYVADRYLKRLPASPDANHHTVYRLELTPKGQQRIDSAVKREQAALAAEQATPADKPKGKATKAAKAPAKAAGTSKRKPKADQPTATAALSEPATATVTVSAEQLPAVTDQPTVAG